MKPPALHDEMSDANENRKSAPDLANGEIPSFQALRSSPLSVQFRREFVGFTGHAGYRHKWLVRAPELQPIVRDFIGV